MDDQPADIVNTADTVNPADTINDTAERVMQLDAELEAAGEATLTQDAVAEQRAALHEWVDTVVGIVASPGVGRVTLIHANGGRSGISSPELPFLMSKPASFETTAES